MQEPSVNDHLVQYRVAADHRLHFGRLFFQVTAFNLGLALALFVVAAAYVGASLAMAMSGLVLIGTAIVVGRLLHQEMRYAAALAAIEASHEALLAVEPPRGRGARAATVICLAVAGAVLTVPAVLRV